MNNYQEIEGTKRSGAEFFKIYALTLLTAFVLMAALQFRLGDEPTVFFKKEQVAPGAPAAPMTPIAGADDLFPIQKLKNLIVNLSF